jgi:hypothetical protein
MTPEIKARPGRRGFVTGRRQQMSDEAFETETELATPQEAPRDTAKSHSRSLK